MKVYEYFDSKWGKAFFRISKALHQYAPPWVEWVTTASSCDVAIVHEVGGAESVPIRMFLDSNKKLVIIQHTYFTSGYTSWETFWERANLTISFHDLTKYTDVKFNFLHSPWGADTDLFHKLEGVIKFRKVFTTGHVAKTECIDKLYQACDNIKSVMYHTGENFKYGSYYKYLPYMEDNALVRVLNESQYISCLREFEGFEMMGVEGLFCGARPIVPNINTYDWYAKYSKVVDMGGDIVSQLIDILKEPAIEPSVEELEEIKSIFDWSVVIGNIFKSIEESV